MPLDVLVTPEVYSTNSGGSAGKTCGVCRTPVLLLAQVVPSHAARPEPLRTLGRTPVGLRAEVGVGSEPRRRREDPILRRQAAVRCRWVSCGRSYVGRVGEGRSVGPGRAAPWCS